MQRIFKIYLIYFVYLFVCLIILPSIHPYVGLSVGVCMSVYLPAIYLFLCLSVNPSFKVRLIHRQIERQKGAHIYRWIHR